MELRYSGMGKTRDLLFALIFGMVGGSLIFVLVKEFLDKVTFTHLLAAWIGTSAPAAFVLGIWRWDAWPDSTTRARRCRSRARGRRTSWHGRTSTRSTASEDRASSCAAEGSGCVSATNSRGWTRPGGSSGREGATTWAGTCAPPWTGARSCAWEGPSRGGRPCSEGSRCSRFSCRRRWPRSSRRFARSSEGAGRAPPSPSDSSSSGSRSCSGFSFARPPGAAAGWSSARRGWRCGARARPGVGAGTSCGAWTATASLRSEGGASGSTRGSATFTSWSRSAAAGCTPAKRGGCRRPRSRAPEGAGGAAAPL